MIRARIGGGGERLLIAPVRGLAVEVPLLLSELEAFGPDLIGLGLSPDELAALREYFVKAEAEPIVSLTSTEASEVRGLLRFGEVRVPNPSFVDLLRWAEAREIAVEALDPSDDRSATLFTEHIGYLELVRRTVSERRIARSPPAPSTPDEFALAWDGQIAPGEGSRRFAAARDRYLARALERAAVGHERVAIVVDRERFDPVRRLLEGGIPLAMTDE